MGQKGDKHTTTSAIAAEMLLKTLSEIEGITSKKMFGGYGVFHDGQMFAIVDSKGEVFMKYDPAQFSDIGASDQHGKMPYFGIPENCDVTGQLWIEWAKRSIEVSKK